MRKWTYKSSIKPQSWEEIKLPVVWENHSQVLLSLKNVFSLIRLARQTLVYSRYILFNYLLYHDFSFWRLQYLNLVTCYLKINSLTRVKSTSQVQLPAFLLKYFVLKKLVAVINVRELELCSYCHQVSFVGWGLDFWCLIKFLHCVNQLLTWFKL